jgi:hypothetical protein
MGRGLRKLELDPVFLGLPENVIVCAEFESTHVLKGHCQVKTVTHAAELEISR